MSDAGLVLREPCDARAYRTAIESPERSKLAAPSDRD